MKNFNKLALVVALGSGFAFAQAPSTPASQSTMPSSTQSTPATQDQQPSTMPQDQKPATAPDSLPSTDQQKSDSSKLPQSDAAPSAAPAAATANGDVQGNIQSAIQKDPSLANSNVTVDVKDGKSVDLTGTVASKDAKDAAERIAKENSNGMKVKNHLKIAGASSDNMNSPKTDSTMPAPKL